MAYFWKLTLRITLRQLWKYLIYGFNKQITEMRMFKLSSHSVSNTLKIFKLSIRIEINDNIMTNLNITHEKYACKSNIRK